MATTPLGALARGLAAGLVGTAAMTGYQMLIAKLRGQPNAKPRRWADAPVPAQLAKRVSEGVFEHKVKLAQAPKLTNLVHFSYGTSWGAVYGLAQGTMHAPTVAHGLGFGTAVWGTAYAVLPPTGLYEAPWKYPPKELALDLSYHLVYGVATAAAYRALEKL
ncbi:MAG TPA: DUF1440 domain-containing protein [Gaiellaceae bacterium]|nr:DUF1440 domain-containing protein [Gaiellaceae bacterium]